MVGGLFSKGVEHTEIDELKGFYKSEYKSWLMKDEIMLTCDHANISRMH